MQNVAVVTPSIASATEPSPLTAEHRRNLVLASLGSMLEFYEFMVFGFFAVTIGKLFFPPDLPEAVRTFQAFALYSLGFLLRPLSGAICGHFGDRFGRKKLFVFTVLLMAASTTAIGLMPTYAQIGVAAPVGLLALRLLQGVAIAGEFAGASVFVFEHVGAGRRGLASGWLLGATYLGFLLGATMTALMANVLAPVDLESWGWRLAFILGGLFGLLGSVLRNRLDETPLFEAVRARAAATARVPALELLRTHRVALARVIGLGTYLGAMIIMLYFYLPTFLQTQYRVDRTFTFDVNAAALLALTVSCPLWGALADRLGPTRILAFGAATLGVSCFLFFENLGALVLRPDLLALSIIGLSVLMSTAATIPLLSATAFPTAVRLSGFGLAYNVGILISAAAPTLVAWVVLEHGKAAVAWYALGLGILGLACALWTAFDRSGSVLHDERI